MLIGALLKASALSSAIGSTFALAAFAIARLFDDPLLVRPECGSGEAEELQAIVVVLATLAIGGLGGFGLAFLSSRFSPTAPRRTFLTLCLVGLGIYGVLAFVRTDQASTAVWLNVMHLVAAAPIVGMLARQLDPDTKRQSLSIGI